jgi:carbon monoxide dehydrogenase subunit G
VKASPAAVGCFLQNIKEVAQFIPGVEEVEGIEGADSGKRYQAIIHDRVGPFQVHVPIELKVVCADDRRLQVDGNGREMMTGSHITMRLQSLISPLDDGSDLDLLLELQVTGRLASLGKSLISRKFNEKMNIFAARLREALEGGGECDSSLSVS